jgi:hypothetical protein
MIVVVVNILRKIQEGRAKSWSAETSSQPRMCAATRGEISEYIGGES